jgi:hypothetical protein
MIAVLEKYWYIILCPKVINHTGNTWLKGEIYSNVTVSKKYLITFSLLLFLFACLSINFGTLNEIALSHLF